MVYSGFWRRAFALIIDGIFIAVVSGVLNLLGGGTILTGVLIGLLYQPFFEASRLQGTPGKNLMGMRITDLQGNRITVKASIIRYIVRIFSGLFLCLGYLAMLFTDKRQTLHDIVAETLVVDGEVKGQNMFQCWFDQVSTVLGVGDKNPSAPSSSSSYGSSVPPSTAAWPAPGTTSPRTSTATPADLAGLYDLFQKGILTEAEYNQKRAELLKKL